MSDHTWPFSHLADDLVRVDQGVVFLGPRTDHHSWSEITEKPTEATVVMSNGWESPSWQKMPAPIVLLGCGTSAASTNMIAIPVGAQESAALGDVIVQQTRVLVVEGTQPRRQHSRCPLGPGVCPALPEWLVRCITNAVNRLPGRSPERTAVAAGLHLLYDNLDGSHALAQTIEGRGKNHNGDYWHAIMHRREPDYGNAKYWFRRVGSHPVFNELPSVLERIRNAVNSTTLDQWSGRLVKSGRWDPFAFVDACEAACGEHHDPEFQQALEEIQHFEMLLLLVQSCEDAGNA